VGISGMKWGRYKRFSEGLWQADEMRGEELLEGNLQLPDVSSRVCGQHKVSAIQTLVHCDTCTQASVGCWVAIDLHKRGGKYVAKLRQASQ